MAVRVQNNHTGKTGELLPLEQRWQKLPSAIVVDISAGAAQIDPTIRPIRPFGQQPRLFGRAVTASCEPPDFGAVLYAADLITPNDVLVISANGHPDTAMIGEIISGVVRRNGGRGVICDGAVRDVGELARWNDFSVFTRHVTPKGPIGAECGSVNITVEFGGREINPGNLIIGDDDGLACLSDIMAEEFIESAEARIKLEAEWEKRLAAGETVKTVFELD